MHAGLPKKNRKKGEYHRDTPLTYLQGKPKKASTFTKHNHIQSSSKLFPRQTAGKKNNPDSIGLPHHTHKSLQKPLRNQIFPLCHDQPQQHCQHSCQRGALALEREEESAQDSPHKRAKARVRRESEEDGDTPGTEQNCVERDRSSVIFIYLLLFFQFCNLAEVAIIQKKI
jgi:hypothetical protein